MIISSKKLQMLKYFAFPLLLFNFPASTMPAMFSILRYCPAIPALFLPLYRYITTVITGWYDDAINH